MLAWLLEQAEIPPPPVEEVSMEVIPVEAVEDDAKTKELKNAVNVLLANMSETMQRTMLETKGVALEANTPADEVRSKVKEMLLTQMQEQQKEGDDQSLARQMSVEEGEVVTPGPAPAKPEPPSLAPPPPPRPRDDGVIRAMPPGSGEKGSTDEGGKAISLHLISFSDLLDYSPQDRQERQFEASVSAEMLQCLLSRHFGTIIFHAFKTLSIFAPPEPAPAPATAPPVVEDNAQSGDSATPVDTEGNTQEGGTQADADAPKPASEEEKEKKSEPEGQKAGDEEASKQPPPSPAETFRPFELLAPAKLTPLVQFYLSQEGGEGTDDTHAVALFLAFRFFDRQGHGSLSKSQLEKILQVSQSHP